MLIEISAVGPASPEHEIRRTTLLAFGLAIHDDEEERLGRADAKLLQTVNMLIFPHGILTIDSIVRQDPARIASSQQVRSTEHHADGCAACTSTLMGIMPAPASDHR
jgi:hypothetical protein